MGLFDFLRSDSGQDRFAEAVARAIRRLSPQQAPAYDAAAFCLYLADGGRLNLQQGFRAWRSASGPARAAVVEALAATTRVQPLEDSFEAVRPRLRPVLHNLVHDAEVPRF